MFRRRVIASVPAWPAAAVLLTAALALSGCKIQATAGSSPPGGTTPGGSAAATAAGPAPASGSLIVEPGAGFSPVYRLISRARSSVDLTMYELADTTAEGALAAAAKRGVDVRVVLNGKQQSINAGAYDYLGSHGVRVVWSSSAKRGVDVQVCGENTSGEYDRAYARLARDGVHISYYSSAEGFYIHGKVVEADDGTGQAKVFIGSENFSSTSLNRNRELGLITSSGPVLSSIASTFAVDFQRGQHWS